MSDEITIPEIHAYAFWGILNSLIKAAKGNPSALDVWLKTANIKPLEDMKESLGEKLNQKSIEGL